MSSFELISLDTGDKVLRAPKKEDEGILQGGSKVYGDQPVIGSVTNLQALRDAKYQRMKAGDSIYSKSHTAQGDGGEGNFRLVTGAAPGTYVDNNGTIIVPTGGDGSAAWLADISYSNVYGGYKFRFLTGDRNSLASDVPKGIKVGDSVNITQYSEDSPVCPATWQLVADDAALPEGAVAGEASAASSASLYLENGEYYYKFELVGAAYITAFGAMNSYDFDSTGAAQAALSGHFVVVVPEGTFRIDGALEVGANKTLLIHGTLSRRSEHSSSTRPVVNLRGNYATVKGFGPRSVIASQNASPNGVVLWGVEDPTTEPLNNRWTNAGNLTIVCSGSAGDKGLSLQSPQYWLGGALYDGHFSDLWIRDATYSIYLNPIANGNTFHNINVWGSKGYSIYCDGIAGGLVTDNNFTNLFVDGSPASVTMVYARYTTHTNFIGMNGEPGAGTMRNIDATCSRINFIGASNTASNGAFSANFSFDILNGVGSARDFSATTSLQSPLMTVQGGDLRIWNSSASSDYNRLSVSPVAEPFSGSGGVKFFPSTRPGSGTTNFYTWFADNVGAGNTRHHVVVDGNLSVGFSVAPKVDEAANLGAPAKRWSAGYIKEIRPGTGAAVWTSGAGSPEGVVSAVAGSMYTRTDGGTGLTLYVKETGAGNTGWVAK